MTALTDWGFVLPFYITILFFISYILWSKYLSKGRMSWKTSEENSINNLLDILGIFFIFVVAFLLMPMLFTLLLQVLSFSLTKENILAAWQAWTILSTTTAIVITLIIIISKKEEGKRQELYKGFVWIFYYLLGITAVFFGMLIDSAINGGLFRYFWAHIIMATIICLLLVYNFVNVALSITRVKAKFHAPLIILVIITALIGGWYGFSIVTDINMQEPRTDRMFVFGDVTNPVVKAHTSSNISIEEGKIEVIIIDLEDAGIELIDDYDEENFRVSAIANDKKVSLFTKLVDEEFGDEAKNIGYNRVQVLSNTKFAIFYKQPLLNKNRANTLIIEGTHTINQNELHIKSADECNQTGCISNLTLQSSTNKSIWIRSLIVKRFENNQQCTITNLTFSETEDARSNCYESNDCFFRDRVNRDRYEGNIEIADREGTEVLRLSNTAINGIVNLRFSISYICRLND